MSSSSSSSSSSESPATRVSAATTCSGTSACHLGHISLMAYRTLMGGRSCDQKMLARVHVPVLAIFGEKDRNVNWRSTVALYSQTIGKNPNASLTIKTFPDGNHNLQQARTGGLREMLQMSEHRASDGYYEGMADWLRTKVLK